MGRGDIYAIIGPNGAGKTTLFNLITGYLKPDAGRIVWKNQDITGLSPFMISRMGICRSFQVAAIYNQMTVIENVQIALFSATSRSMRFFPAAKKMLVRESEAILEKVGLTEQLNELAENLPHGDRKRLELAIVLGNRPEMILLDEPTAGMSPVETNVTMELIKSLNHQQDITILFTEHDMSVVFGIAKIIAVLYQGKFIAIGTATEIRSDETVRTIYLGEESI